MQDFKLPDIGEGISEARLVEWLVKVGDRVADGDDVATISTDKIDVELPAPCSGRVAELCWKPGETVKVGQVLLRIEREGAVASAPAEAEAEVKAAAPATPAPKAAAATPPPAPAASPKAPQVVAAPAIRRMARERDIDLTRIVGSGPAGRILERDLLAAAEPVAASTATPAAAAGVRRLKLPGVRAVAAERLSQSVHTLATSTLTFEVRGDGLLALLQRLAPEAERRGVKLTPTVALAKCVAAALLRHERFNATIDEEARELLLHPRVNLGIAVSAPGRLLVPVLPDVGGRPLMELAGALADLAERVRAERLVPADMKDGTFSLSSTGGLERTTFLAARPIVNPPQTAILWASRITQRPRAGAEGVELGPMMAMSLSFDHRFIDGAEATAFCNDVAGYVETPEGALA